MINIKKIIKKNYLNNHFQKRRREQKLIEEDARKRMN